MAEGIRPEHYRECCIECIDAMEIAYGTENVALFCVMNAFKYLWRYKNKNGIEDLMKASTYLDMAANLADSNSHEVNQAIESMDYVLARYLRKEEVQ